MTIEFRKPIEELELLIASRRAEIEDLNKTDAIFEKRRNQIAEDIAANEKSIAELSADITVLRSAGKEAQP